jgi:hypothetical protein
VTHQRRSFLRQHSLSLATIIIVISLIFLYRSADSSTHLGSFFGNAIADWSGVLVTVLATKFLYEKGSAESRRPPNSLLSPLLGRFRDHSLTVFLLVSGGFWIALFVHMNSESKWGQVVGNIVSEWTQVLGMVILTKRLIEYHSKDSNR